MAQEKGRQMRFTEQELALIKSTFKGNEKLVKLMRKVFLPELDPDAPIGEMIDLWMTIPLKEMDPQTAHVNILARGHLIQYLDTRLSELNHLAELPEEKTEEERKEKQAKDSAK